MSEAENKRRWKAVMKQVNRNTTRLECADMMDAAGVKHGYRDMTDEDYTAFRDRWIHFWKLSGQIKRAERAGSRKRLQELEEQQADDIRWADAQLILRLLDGRG